MKTQLRLRSLPDQLYDYLYNAIATGEIKGGERIVESELSERFRISRSPIRECFRILESEGLVIIQPRRGAIVKEITRKDIEDAFPVRACLEGLAAKLAIPNMGEKEIGILDDLVEKIGEAIDKNNVRAFIKFNFAFHNLFIKSSKNEILQKTIRNLGNSVWYRIAYLSFESQSIMVASNDMHRTITKAFREKQPIVVQRLLEEHIDHAKQWILRNM
jgi:DNA-binding GntR family transcriptional regulator